MDIRVLWVEEEPSTLSYERKYAELLGWKITISNTVSDGLKQIEKRAFDLLIMDLILPLNEEESNSGTVDVEAGIKMICSIKDITKSSNTMPDIPILVISAIGDQEQKDRVKKLLAAETMFIPKPVDEYEYKRVVKDLNDLILNLKSRSK